MTKYKKEIEAWGEGIAANWLEEHNYQIIARNIRTDYGEIDIIAQQGDVTIFIEVKTLTSSINFFQKPISRRANNSTCSILQSNMPQNMKLATGKLTQSQLRENRDQSRSLPILRM